VCVPKVEAGALPLFLELIRAYCMLETHHAVLSSIENAELAGTGWAPARAEDAIYCELHNNRPKFALFLLFSGAILQIAPAQSGFQ
jgi:hypothetical protein